MKTKTAKGRPGIPVPAFFLREASPSPDASRHGEEPGVQEPGKDSIYTGSLILVNQNVPCREIEPSRLVPAPCPGNNTAAGIYLERTAAVLLNRLMTEIRGWREITLVSGWRSYEEQARLWEASCRENGEEFTKKYVALPGHSEHHTGLAVDLGLKSGKGDFIRPDFPDSGICREFRRRAARYGFILRYPPGKERVTGIAHEPWHFRYVGPPHAEIMDRLELTLEEYHPFIKGYPYGAPFRYRSGDFRAAVSYLPAGAPANWSPGKLESRQTGAPANRNPGKLALRQTGAPAETLLNVQKEGLGMVSGNNMDGWIVTIWNRKGMEA